MAFKIRSLTLDAKKQPKQPKGTKTVRGKFKPSSEAERQFQKALRRVAQVAGHIVDGHVVGASVVRPEEMQKRLNEYAEALDPWAKRQAAKMLAEVQKSNKRAYNNKAATMGRALKAELDSETYTGALALALQEEQVALIKSIPIEAGLRAQKIAREAFIEGARAVPDQSVIDDLKEQLGLSTEVATSRAKLIAVTETARANASINQARAMKAGAGKYRWHNSGDGAVRDAHKFYKGKRMQGQIFSWDNPPTLDDGTKGHPGTFPRCRCFAEPIFDDE